MKLLILQSFSGFSLEEKASKGPHDAVILCFLGTDKFGGKFLSGGEGRRSERRPPQGNAYLAFVPRVLTWACPSSASPWPYRYDALLLQSTSCYTLPLLLLASPPLSSSFLSSCTYNASASSMLPTQRCLSFFLILPLPWPLPSTPCSFPALPLLLPHPCNDSFQTLTLPLLNPRPCLTLPCPCPCLASCTL